LLRRSDNPVFVDEFVHDFLLQDLASP
jgi:hypothetical protein